MYINCPSNDLFTCFLTVLILYSSHSQSSKIVAWITLWVLISRGPPVSHTLEKPISALLTLSFYTGCVYKFSSYLTYFIIPQIAFTYPVDLVLSKYLRTQLSISSTCSVLRRRLDSHAAKVYMASNTLPLSCCWRWSRRSCSSLILYSFFCSASSFLLSSSTLWSTAERSPLPLSRAQTCTIQSSSGSPRLAADRSSLDDKAILFWSSILLHILHVAPNCLNCWFPFCTRHARRTYTSVCFLMYVDWVGLILLLFYCLLITGIPYPSIVRL